MRYDTHAIYPITDKLQEEGAILPIMTELQLRGREARIVPGGASVSCLGRSIFVDTAGFIQCLMKEDPSYP